MKLIRHETYIEILSRKNRFQFAIGKGRYYGLMGGIQLNEQYDWWHFAIGITVVMFYIKIEWRWRVANLGYPKGEVYVV